MIPRSDQTGPRASQEGAMKAEIDEASISDCNICGAANSTCSTDIRDDRCGECEVAEEQLHGRSTPQNWGDTQLGRRDIHYRGQVSPHKFRSLPTETRKRTWTSMAERNRICASRR